MKKFAGILAFVALAAMIGIGAAYIMNHDEPALSEKDAQQIALQAAGVDAENAQNMHVVLEKEDGMKSYDVSFSAKKPDGTVIRYDYDVDAETGAIYANKTAVTEPGLKPAQKADAQGEITEAEATAIALKHAGLTEQDTTRLHTEYERDLTGNTWSVDFVAGNTEYDYDISAADGSIIKAENEPVG